MLSHEFDEDFAEKVSTCIRLHSYRKATPPDSIEDKILFDADKIDVTGALGTARTLQYTGAASGPLYSLSGDGQISDGTNDSKPSFFHEYKYKLEKIYSRFYTERGREIAAQRQDAAVDFYNHMLQEVHETYRNGIKNLHEVLESS